MKKSVKLLAVMLALIFAFSVSAFFVSAAPADDNTITITGSKTGHTYTAYQIFDGEYDSSTNKLNNIQWGAGFDTTKVTNLITALKGYVWDLADLDPTTDAAAIAQIRADIAALGSDAAHSTAAAVAAAIAPLVSTQDAEQLADIFSGFTKDPGVNGTYESGNVTWDNVADGYWLIKDKGPNNGTDDVISDYILKVVNDVTIQIKGSVPTVDKKVSTDGQTTYVDGATAAQAVNVQVGDILDYEIIGTLPTNYIDYSTYKMVFDDTADADINLINGTVEVYVDVAGNGTLTQATSGFTAVVNNTNPDTLKVTINDTKALTDASSNTITTTNDSKIVVKYQAEVLHTTIADTVDVNSASITYSNDPNSTGTGTTTPDTVNTVTQMFNLVKYDGTSNAVLSGAEFELYATSVAAANKITLYKESDTVYHVADSAEITAGTNIVTTITTVDTTSGILIKGLDQDITYKLLETQAPVGYNPITTPIDVTVNSASTAATPNISSGVYTNTANVVGVANNSGTELPETGGFGTVIFISIGAVAIIGAGIFLVTNKRMMKESI